MQMTSKVLYLFPDTNLFAQCRALEELDWDQWGDFDEVHLLVSRPVQAEIDNQKNKGGERLARRAKATSSLFREIIIGSSDHKVIRSGTPVVKLLIANGLKPNPALGDQLDYRLNDDLLVGIAHLFAENNTGADVRILTHDTGPMASAKMVGAQIAPIPDEWLLPPETSEKDKAMKALEAKVKRLESAEPSVDIVFTNSSGDGVNALEGEIAAYEPLTPGQVSDLVGRLQQRFPMRADFAAPPEPPLLYGHKLMKVEQTYEPPPEKEVKKYQEDLYPAWLRECEKVLEQLHTICQNALKVDQFNFLARNSGSRPAKDALVTIQARGNFKLVASKKDEDGNEEASHLPKPPEAPRGFWTPKGLAGFAAMQRLAQGHFKVPAFAQPAFPADLLRLSEIQRHDANKFYWKSRPANRKPTSKFAYECEQWRHGGDLESFWGYLHFDPDQHEISGALECKIQAENLTTTAKLLVPVHMTIKKQSILHTAENKIDLLSMGLGRRRPS